jgi:hypothetical protein
LFFFQHNTHYKDESEVYLYNPSSSNRHLYFNAEVS